MKQVGKNPFDVQGHRGARGLYPEHTLVGIEAAIALGVTSLELDIGMSADGVLVVWHDPFISPELCLCANGKSITDIPRLWLRDLPLAKIQSYDCGSLNPDVKRFPQQKKCPGSHILTLQEVFDLTESLNPQIRYTLDVKVNPLHPAQTFEPERLTEKVVDLVQQNCLEDRTTIQSFDWQVLEQVKTVCPEIQTGAVILHSATMSTLMPDCLPSPFLAGWDFREFAGNIAALLQMTQFVDVYSPNFETLLPESDYFLQPCWVFQEMGLQVIPWTVNTIADMERLIGLGVDGLITDFPDRAVHLLKQRR